MSTDRETTRVVRSWLEEGVTALPDRVLDAVLDQVPATPQRRSWWPARRSNQMNAFVKLIAAAAAVVLVAVVGYQFLPRNGGIGSGPTIAPSPSPALLARGTFTAQVDYTVALDATGGGSSVTGTMTVSHATRGVYAVDLECTRTVDGLIWIAGDVTQSTNSDAPAGTRAAIVLKPGSPVRAIFAWQTNDPRSASCQAFLDSMLALGDPSGGMEPIVGNLELGP